MQLNCAREDGDFKTLSSPVKSYKGPRIVAFLPLVSFTGCFDHGSLFYVYIIVSVKGHPKQKNEGSLARIAYEVASAAGGRGS